MKGAHQPRCLPLLLHARHVLPHPLKDANRQVYAVAGSEVPVKGLRLAFVVHALLPFLIILQKVLRKPFTCCSYKGAQEADKVTCHNA